MDSSFYYILYIIYIVYIYIYNYLYLYLYLYIYIYIYLYLDIYIYVCVCGWLVLIHHTEIRSWPLWGPAPSLWADLVLVGSAVLGSSLSPERDSASGRHKERTSTRPPPLNKTRGSLVESSLVESSLVRALNLRIKSPFCTVWDQVFLQNLNYSSSLLLKSWVFHHVS